MSWISWLKFALSGIATAMVISGCKSLTEGTVSQDSSSVLETTAADTHPRDMTGYLWGLDSIEKLMTKSRKESSDGFGQLLLVSMEKQMHQIPANIPYDLTQAEKVELTIRLECPRGGTCEAWDRLGTLMLVHNYPPKNEVPIEIIRFMTPYGEGATWTVDVTEYAAILSGKYTIRTYIQSWSRLSDKLPTGWAMTLGLRVTGTNPSKLRPRVVHPMFTFASIPYGDPTQTAVRYASNIPGLKNVYKKAVLKTLITGHGQSNLDNCAEFCNKKHTIKIGSQAYFPLVWRDDCARTVSSTQQGNYQSSRAGWCPGDYVRAQSFDITKALDKPFHQGSYFPEQYVNTCRPNQVPCKGCENDVTCAYDDHLHTPPSWLVTANIILYR